MRSTVIVLPTDQMTIDEKMIAAAEIKLGQCLATPKAKQAADQKNLRTSLLLRKPEAKVY